MNRDNGNPFDAEVSNSLKLTSFIFRKMLVGAGVGAVVVFGPVLFIYFLVWVGSFLPPESKEADDPSQGEFSMVAPAPTIASLPVVMTSRRAI